MRNRSETLPPAPERTHPELASALGDVATEISSTTTST